MPSPIFSALAVLAAGFAVLHKGRQPNIGFEETLTFFTYVKAQLNLRGLT